MELLEGQTLSALLKKGRLTVQLAIRYATQIADAIRAGHAHGVTDRDQKPGNIMLTDGRVKVYDFGLAKVERALTFANTESITQQGLILGTLQYMSPEQVQGKEVDTRSDIFSLGLVLYEMVTGTNPFASQTNISTIAAITDFEPKPASAI